MVCFAPHCKHSRTKEDVKSMSERCLRGASVGSVCRHPLKKKIVSTWFAVLTMEASGAFVPHRWARSKSEQSLPLALTSFLLLSNCVCKASCHVLYQFTQKGLDSERGLGSLWIAFENIEFAFQPNHSSVDSKGTTGECIPTLGHLGCGRSARGPPRKPPALVTANTCTCEEIGESGKWKDEPTKAFCLSCTCNQGAFGFQLVLRGRQLASAKLLWPSTGSA
eukprot:270751-Amphidinium_carterae.1